MLEFEVQNFLSRALEPISLLLRLQAVVLLCCWSVEGYGLGQGCTGLRYSSCRAILSLRVLRHRCLEQM